MHGYPRKADVVLGLGTPTMVRDAVVAGTGAALLPHSLVADDLAQGRLISWGKAEGRLIAWGKAPKESEIWVLYSSRRCSVARLPPLSLISMKSFRRARRKNLPRCAGDEMRSRELACLTQTTPSQTSASGRCCRKRILRGRSQQY
jgi:hypothetical protein